MLFTVIPPVPASNLQEVFFYNDPAQFYGCPGGALPPWKLWATSKLPDIANHSDPAQFLWLPSWQVAQGQVA